MGTGAEYKRRQQEEAAKAAAKEAAGDRADEPPAKRQRRKGAARAGQSAPPESKGQFPLPVVCKSERELTWAWEGSRDSTGVATTRHRCERQGRTEAAAGGEAPRGEVREGGGAVRGAAAGAAQAPPPPPEDSPRGQRGPAGALGEDLQEEGSPRLRSSRPGQRVPPGRAHAPTRRRSRHQERPTLSVRGSRRGGHRLRARVEERSLLSE